MMGQRETVLCRYQYDPLDRVVNCAPLNQDSVQRFYRKNRLATEIQGQVQYSVFEHQEQLLAQRQHLAGRIDAVLLATDLQRSVLHAVAVSQHQRAAYSPYGHRSPESGLTSLLGFNGERRDPVTGHYLLGNGYRAFNPVLMRFNSPDSLSPFGRGGVNAYVYCAGDPVNRLDPQGSYFVPALVTGLTQGALLPRVFSFLDTAVAVSSGIAGRLSRGFQAGVNAVNRLRPSGWAAARYTRINNERLDSIFEVQKLKKYVTDSPPFTNTTNYVKAKKAAVNNFIGPRDLEKGPTRDFAQLLEDEALANATLKRVMTDQQKLQLAETRMMNAIENWRAETGVSQEYLNRVMNSAINLRSGT